MVLHQLSARLGLSGHNGVGEALQRILLKCAQDHPYHTLPVLLAQALMDKDKEHGKTPIKKVSLKWTQKIHTNNVYRGFEIYTFLHLSNVHYVECPGRCSSSFGGEIEEWGVG